MIHALPGLGADHRIFPAPWNALPGFVAHDWPAHHGEQTLAEVASSLCDVFDIHDDDTLVGASLGGMVACEVAKLRRLEALYLIGSATDKTEVSWFLKTLRPFAAIAPFDLLKLAAGGIPSDVARMFSGVDTAFMRRMCAAIFAWDGLDSISTPCFRIHGSKDRVISKPAHVDLLLDGGHLISMTHAHECVDFISAKTRR